MLKHVGDQAERFSGGLIGATLGIIFSFSATNHVFGAFAFLLAFFFLYCIQSLPRYFANRPDGVGPAFLVFLVFLILWTLATIHFSNLYVFGNGWSANQIDTRVLLAQLTLFIASLISVASAVIEKLDTGRQ